MHLLTFFFFGKRLQKVAFWWHFLRGTAYCFVKPAWHSGWRVGLGVEETPSSDPHSDSLGDLEPVLSLSSMSTLEEKKNPA